MIFDGVPPASLSVHCSHHRVDYPRSMNELFSKYPRRVAILVVGVCVVAAFWSAVGNGFTNYDDPKYVTDNPHVQRGLTLESLTWAGTATHASNWHPLTWISHMLDWSLFGDDPWGHHLTSVLLHLLNTLLLFVVLDRMTDAPGRSGFAALLFGIHPLHVESVAWIAERKDVLSTAFWLLAILAYIGWVQRPTPRRYGMVLVALGLGLCAKPMLVTLPLTLLLLDFWPLRRFRTESFGELIREKLPMLPVVTLSGVVTFLVQQRGGATGSLDAVPAVFRIANGIVAYAVYLRKTFWPFDLAVFYPHPGTDLPLWQIGFSAAVLGLLSYAAFRLRERFPYVLAGWLWYLITLVPVIGIVQVGVQSLADRYTYVPLIGIFCIAAWGVPDLLERTSGDRKRSRQIATSVAALVAMALVVLTWAQTLTWRNSETLFAHALNVKESAVAHNNLGLALADSDRGTDAIGHFERAVQLDSDHASSRNNLGLELAKQGRHAEALDHYGQAIELAPGDSRAYSNLGLTLAALGRADEAVDRYRQAIALDPEYAKAHTNLAITLADHGKLEQAVESYRRALQIDPRQTEAHNNLGLALMRLGQAEQAVGHFVEAIRLRPDYGRAHANLAAAFYTTGKFAEARKHLELAQRHGTPPPPALVRALSERAPSRR